MPTMTLKNPYKGVNAHLHSIAQNPKSYSTLWRGFHLPFINGIVGALNRDLPETYVAEMAQSIQIATEELGILPPGESPLERELYDSEIGIERTRKASESLPSGLQAYSIGDIGENNFLSSVIIHRVEDAFTYRCPVTRIELLTLLSKSLDGGALTYRSNRRTALHLHTNLVEVDILHQFPSPIPRISSYPEDENSYAYSIAITDMRGDHNPNWVTFVHVVDVDQSLPTNVQIPLADDDFIELNFNSIYQDAFKNGRWGMLIDYNKLPRKFESYSQADQDRIKAVMERAKELSDAE